MCTVSYPNKNLIWQALFPNPHLNMKQLGGQFYLVLLVFSSFFYCLLRVRAETPFTIILLDGTPILTHISKYSTLISVPPRILGHVHWLRTNVIWRYAIYDISFFTNDLFFPRSLVNQNCKLLKENKLSLYQTIIYLN